MNLLSCVNIHKSCLDLETCKCRYGIVLCHKFERYIKQTLKMIIKLNILAQQMIKFDVSHIIFSVNW